MKEKLKNKAGGLCAYINTSYPEIRGFGFVLGPAKPDWCMIGRHGGIEFVVYDDELTQFGQLEPHELEKLQSTQGKERTAVAKELWEKYKDTVLIEFCIRAGIIKPP